MKHDRQERSNREQTPFEQIPHWILDKATGKEIHLYLILRRYTGRSDGCWPSRETLAEEMALSISTIKRLIKGLEEHGALQITPRYTKTGGQTSNFYYLAWRSPEEVFWDGVREIENDPGRGLADGLPPRPTPEPYEGSTEEPPPGSPKDHEYIPNRTNKTIGQSAALALADKQFDKFWEIYPRKVGKPQAKKAFVAQLREVTFEEILSQTTRYAKARRGEDSKFTKHPATFLNSKPWLDEPEAPYDPDSWLNNPRTTPVDNGIED